MKQKYFDKLTRLIEEYAEAILRKRDNVKITDQSEAQSGGSKQKQRTALHQGWKWAFKISGSMGVKVTSVGSSERMEQLDIQFV